MDDETTEELTVQCENCTTDVPQDDAVEINGEHYCDSCADEFGHCENCSEAVRQDEMVLVNNMDTYRWRNQEMHVCESCADQYDECASCSERYDHLTETLDGDEVCEGCRENMNYCEDCDGYYSGCGDDDHSHSGCDCEPPSGLKFRVKNGEIMINQDERVALDLPGGVISEVGMGLIENLVRQEGQALASPLDDTIPRYTDPWYKALEERSKITDTWYEFSYRISEVGSEWQTNRGNFTKRLSRLAHLNGLKLSADLLTKIGNVGREQSQGSSVNLEFSRDLNMSAADWYHEDSCWFTSGSYGESRCALKSNGGIGMRTFDGDGPCAQITGRAWAMPMRKVEKLILPREITKYHEAGTPEGGMYGDWKVEQPEGPAMLQHTFTPTFDTENPDAWMIFNGYGNLGGYAAARIMAQMSGMTYRKCEFSDSTMYINAGGFIVAPEADAVRVAQDGLRLKSEIHSDLYHTEAQQMSLAA